MGMTTISEFNHNPCPKWDATDVNAYFDLSLDESNPTRLVLDNSWGETSVDLTPAIKAGESVTHLMLDPVDVPVYLRYDNEAGDSECIHGDDLSRIISMRYLKDVDQGTAPVAGDVYMLSGDNIFYTHNLAEFETTTNNRLTSLEGRMTNVENRVLNLELALADLTNRVAVLESILTKPNNIPSDVRVVWGNINNLGDPSNTDNRDHGLYTHDKDTNVYGDQYFS